MDPLTLAIIAALIILNGVFVAAEFAIMGVPRASIAQLSARGNSTAKLVEEILNDPERQDGYIATAQLGITLASLGLGMYGEHALAEWLGGYLEAFGTGEWIAVHATAGTLSVVVLTYFHVVLGEIVPKSLALSHVEIAALWITRPMIWIYRALRPVVTLLTSIGNLILRIFGIRLTKTTLALHTIEEIQYIVEESREGGLLREEAGAVLLELLEFSELTAVEVMIPRVRAVGIPIGADSREIREGLSRSPHTRYPVYDTDLDHIVGVLHVKELLRLLLTGESVTEQQVHTLPYVPETAPLDEVLTSMIDARTQMVVVMDEHGGTAGIVTLSDLMEEVIGEIDESATHLPQIHQDSEGRIHVSGTVRLEELGDDLDIDLEHEEVDTVSGLVLSLLGRPPEIGDRVTFGGVRFIVERIEGRGVAESLVEAADPGARPLRLVGDDSR